MPTAAAPRPRAAAGGEADQASGELWTTFLAGVSATLFAIVYLWRIAPDLESSCARVPAAVAADWVLLAALVFSTFALGACCFDSRRRTARMKTVVAWVVPAGFVSSLVKTAGVMFILPLWCSWFESLWCLSFGLIILTRYVEASEVRRASVKRPKGTDPAQAEAAVAVVIGKMRVAVPQGESADDLERGEFSSQCAICLSDWSPEDVTRTTPCNHTFHEDCLRAWLTRQMCSRGVQTCAVCRRDLQAEPSAAEAPAAEDPGPPPRPEAL